MLTTEEILRDLNSGKTLPEESNMDFVIPKEELNKLSQLIQNMTDYTKLKDHIERANNEARKNHIAFNKEEYIKMEEPNCKMSMSKFANACYINPSHLCQFLNGEKRFSRDKLLCIFITLGMDIETINENLKKYDGVDTLHIHNRRDYYIILGITEKKNIDDIDNILKNAGMKGII